MFRIKHNSVAVTRNTTVVYNAFCKYVIRMVYVIAMQQIGFGIHLTVQFYFTKSWQIDD